MGPESKAFSEEKKKKTHKCGQRRKDLNKLSPLLAKNTITNGQKDCCILIGRKPKVGIP